MNARESAFRILQRILHEGAYANVALRIQLQRSPMSMQERGLCTELVYGVLRHLNRLEYILKKLSKRPLEKMDSVVLLATYLALYQIIYLDRIPAPVAVNESVDLVKKFSHIGSAKFTNAVLRSFLRRVKEFGVPTIDEDPIMHVALTYGIPAWMVVLYKKQWGMEKTLDLGRTWLVPSPNYIRINTLRKNKETIIQEWKQENIIVSPTILSDCVQIMEGDVTRLQKWLTNGDIYYQDIASMLVGYAVDPQSGEWILDSCAAPGGKSTHMAALSQNQATIIAGDIYPHKVKLIHENANRIGASSVQATVRDATKYIKDDTMRYDKVLVDAPCSGLGVIGRRPDLKWRRSKETLAEFPSLQTEILDCAASYVRTGGRLVYSTCTLNRSENEDVINAFLSKHKEYHLEPFPLPSIGNVSDGYLTIWPSAHHSDGFFIAVMKKEDCT